MSTDTKKSRITELLYEFNDFTHMKSLEQNQAHGMCVQCSYHMQSSYPMCSILSPCWRTEAPKKCTFLAQGHEVSGK